MALPLPKVVYDVEPGGGIVTSMKGGNALTKSALENQITKAQAQYAPYQAYGNAFLTNQQAQWLPYQYQMQALSNPLLWMAAQNNPALMNQLKTMMANPMSAIGGGNGALNIPLPNQGGGSTSDGLMSMFMNLINGNKQPEQNAVANQPAAVSSNPFSPATANTGNFGASNQATPQEVDAAVQRGENSLNANAPKPTIGYQTPAANQASNMAAQGGLSGENAMNAAQAQQQAATDAVTGQTNTQTELQNIRTKQLTTQAQMAIDAKKALHAFHRNYGKSTYKGQYITPDRAENLYKGPGRNNSPEQLTNRYANQLVNYLAGLGNTPAGKTDAGRELIASGKMDIGLSPDAEQELYDSFDSQLSRMETLRDMGTDFYRRNPGATDEELIGLMNSYNRHAPSYDPDTGKAHPENEEKYKDFTSPKALESYRTNGDYNPYAGKKSYTKHTENNYKQPSGKIEQTKKIGKIEYVKFVGDENWHKRVK